MPVNGYLGPCEVERRAFETRENTETMANLWMNPQTHDTEGKSNQLLSRREWRMNHVRKSVISRTEVILG